MSLHIYIPRILGSVHKKTVCDAFSRMRIGDVTELDMIYKINENRNAYYIAFVKINPYNTPHAADLQSKLKQNVYIRLLYDEEAGQYWELKKYIPREDRLQEINKQQNTTHNTCVDINDENSDFITPLVTQYISPFTAQDRIDLVREYEEIERDIYIEISTI